MKEIKRQSIKSSIYTYLGVGLGFLITAILFPRYLSQEEIGVLSLLVSYSMISARMGTLGFPSAIAKLFPQFRTQDRDHNGFLFIVILVSIIGFIAFLIGFMIVSPQIISNNTDKSPIFAQYFNLIIPLSLFQILYFNLDTYSNMIYLSTGGSFFKEFFQRVLFLIGLAFYVFFSFKFHFYVLWYSWAINGITILFVIYLIYNKHFNVKPNLSFLTWPLIKSLISVSLFGLLSGLSAFAVLRIDAIMINAFIDSSAVGIYSTTFAFGLLVSIPSRALVKITVTYIADAHQSGDYNTITNIFKKSVLTQFIVGLLLLMLIWSNIHNINKILPAEYAQGQWVILYIGIANLIRMLAGGNDAIIANSEYYKVQSLFLFLFLISAILFNVALIPPLGITGAALASLLAILFFNILKTSFIYAKFKIQPYNFKLVLIGMFGLAVYGLSMLIPQIGNLYVDVVLRSGVITVLFGTGTIYFNFSEDLTKLFNEYKDKLFIKR